MKYLDICIWYSQNGLILIRDKHNMTKRITHFSHFDWLHYYSECSFSFSIFLGRMDITALSRMTLTLKSGKNKLSSFQPFCSWSCCGSLSCFITPLWSSTSWTFACKVTLIHFWIDCSFNDCKVSWERPNTHGHSSTVFPGSGTSVWRMDGCYFTLIELED